METPIVTKKLTEIHDKYASFHTENAEQPKHFVLGIEARQAIKLIATPYIVPSSELKDYLGIPVIKLEEVVIVE